MWGWITLVLGGVKSGLDWLVGRQKEREREDLKDAGRNEQRLSDSDQAVNRAREANARREDVSRLSGDALDDELRDSLK